MINKAQLLKKRHISIVIEWGGVENMFINCSDMSEEGVIEFLEIMNLNSEKEINERLTKLISDEDAKQKD